MILLKTSQIKSELFNKITPKDQNLMNQTLFPVNELGCKNSDKIDF